MRDVGVEPVGVSPAPPDFIKLAAAYGIDAERLSSAGELGAALTRAHAKRQPCIIEIAIE
jgi:acetolactate synthase-1/2/3 large subunit